MTMVERVYWDVAKVWCYNPDTFEFTMELNCDPHPAYPGQYLKPDYYLLVPPPSAEQYETCIAENGEWKIVPNYKDIPLYDKTTKEVLIYTSIGIDCPETHTPIKPISSESYVVWQDTKWMISAVLLLEYNKQLKKDALRENFDANFSKPKYSQTLQAYVDCRRDSIHNDLQNYQSLHAYMEEKSVATTCIRLSDNSMTAPITASQLKELITELVEKGLINYSNKWYIEDMIDSCMNQDELDSIQTDVF